jgi:hypothetical protein
MQPDRPLDVGEHQLAARGQDPPHLGEHLRLGPGPGLDVVEHQAGQHPVERGVRVGQLLGVAVVEAHREPGSPRLAACSVQRALVGVDPDDLDVGMTLPGGDDEAAGATADIEHPQTGPQLGGREHGAVQGLDPGQPSDDVVER